MKLKIKPVLRDMVLIRVVADAVIVNTALLCAYIVFFFFFTEKAYQDNILQGLGSYYNIVLSEGVLLTAIALTVFSLSGFYTRGRSYQSRYKVLLIFQAVSLVYLIFGFLIYLFGDFLRPTPQRVVLLAWLLTLGATSFARLYSMFWRKGVIKEVQFLDLSHRGESHERVLVIGGAGYIGSVLCRKLLAEGHRVKVLDALLYGGEAIQALLSNKNFQFMEGDSRDIEAVVRAMKDMDVVVHLGEIVGDPATALDEKLTQEINVAATRMVAQAAKGYGASRFIYASSCSVYGANDQILTERSSVNPLSLYARAKIDSENTLLAMNDHYFHPVILRFATVYGLSPRPRFDLVINLLTAKAVQDGEITVFGGDQWRPFVHVSDVSSAIIKVLKAPLSKVKGQVFNVGSEEQNYTIAQLGGIINKIIPEAKLIIQENGSDLRDYRVSFEKIQRELNFLPQKIVDDAIQEISVALRTGVISHYGEKQYSNYKTLSEEGGRLSIAKRKINELCINTTSASKASSEQKASSAV